MEEEAERLRELHSKVSEKEVNRSILEDGKAKEDCRFCSFPHSPLL